MHERIKARKIADVLVSYYFRNHIDDMTVDLKVADSGTTIAIHGKTDAPIPDIYSVCEGLHQTRRVEFEDMYEDLIGTRSAEDDLELLALIVDEAEVAFEENILTLTVHRFRKP